MEKVSEEKAARREALEALFARHGVTDFKWMDPRGIVVSQWVRMKCMFGCREYGHNACCPPNTPSVAECERFFREYREAAVFRFRTTVEQPEDRFAWTKGVNAGLLELEREVFLAGCERAFLLFMDSCCMCGECSGARETCRSPRHARPAPEALAVDVYATVRRFGYPIAVRTDYDQEMSRFSFLMIE